MEHGSEPMSRAEAIYEALTGEVLPAYGYVAYGYIADTPEDYASESVRAGIEDAVEGGLTDAAIYRLATEAALTAAVDFAGEQGLTEYISGRVRNCLQMAALSGVSRSGSDVVERFWPWTARVTELETGRSRSAAR